MWNRLAKHPHNNLLIVSLVIINHIESYDNLILIMVDIFFYGTVLFLDISPFWVLGVDTQVVE